MAEAVAFQPTEAMIVLTLTQREANVLRTITTYIGGSPDPGEPRAAVDSIRLALVHFTEELHLDISGRLVIQNGPEDELPF